MRRQTLSRTPQLRTIHTGYVPSLVVVVVSPSSLSSSSSSSSTTMSSSKSVVVRKKPKSGKTIRQTFAWWNWLEWLIQAWKNAARQRIWALRQSETHTLQAVNLWLSDTLKERERELWTLNGLMYTISDSFQLICWLIYSIPFFVWLPLLLLGSAPCWRSLTCMAHKLKIGDGPKIECKHMA